ncbi:NAD(P)-binding domain-containing protein [Geothrix sp. 21YS21S-2]|uniref:NAD(P)-binding domain-containing protein n=1 Tax=Geothrix sp. 21YS21S-2 TaxID=3068893 RepID=UPI0027BB1FF7|nr:NAD(P)-binding domain-containing protein [Geothrix sp. 21YS21S-2]
MRITILGLGRMGAPMARNLIELGHEVTLWNRTPERADVMAAPGVHISPTVSDAVAKAQVALTMVSDDAAEEALTYGPGGLLEELGHGAIHLCMSTIGVDTSRRLAEAHAKAGQGYVAAPVLGKPSDAASRRLWVLAAGPETQVNRCLVALEALGRGITRVGTRAEVAHALKLGANLLTVAMVETLGEVLAFGEKAGFAPADYLRLLNLGLLKSPPMDAFGGLMVRQDYEPSDQTLDLAAKDLELVIRSSRDLGVAMPMAAPLLLQVENAAGRGLGGRDLTALALVHRQDAKLDEPAPVPPAEPARPLTKSERRKNAAARKAGEPERRVGTESRRPAKEAPPEVHAAAVPRPHVPAEPRPHLAAPPRPHAPAEHKAHLTVPPKPPPPRPHVEERPHLEPEPAALAAPEPVPAPEPKPIPAPEPEPIPAPEPKPIPAPEPVPAPSPGTVPEPVPGPVPEPGAVKALVDEPSFAAIGPEGALLVDLDSTTHFEAIDGAVHAWVEGRRHATPWRSFEEVELAFNQVLFVRIQRTILLNPQAVLDIRSLFGGRAKVRVAGGIELPATREAAKRLRFLLGE